MSSTQTKSILVERPPVVVIMGHIDHGKSTLLDFIRKSNIVAGEAGGITQHVAAYEVVHNSENGEKKITFIDTPGHEAFGSIRSRGAKVADIAILLVSAEDGVKQQTVEALKAIVESKTPYIVAINKIDSPKADLNRTKASLIENEVYLEGLGGDIPYAEISAKTGAGIPDLLNLVLLVAELEELKSEQNVPAEGIVVEANKDTKKGIIATVIIKNGSLKIGDTVACDNSFSPIRALTDTNNKKLTTATFSTPIVIAGWSELPMLGSVVKTFSNKKEAEAYSAGIHKDENERPVKSKDKNTVTIPLIIKSDVSGSLDAIEHQVKKVTAECLEFIIVEKSTGNISEANVKKASAYENSIVIGFNVGIDNQAVTLAERNKTNIKKFSIVYDITDYLKEVAEEKRPRLETEEIMGSAKILRTFSKVKNIQVVGGKIKEGTLRVGNKVKIMRRNEEIAIGTIKNLQQQKSEVKEVKDEGEFGAAIESKIEISENDHIQAFSIVVK